MVKVGDASVVWRSGMTVEDLLQDLGDPFPYPVVRIGERVVSGPDFSNVKVPDDSEVFLIPLVVGG